MVMTGGGEMFELALSQLEVLLTIKLPREFLRLTWGEQRGGKVS